MVIFHYISRLSIALVLGLFLFVSCSEEEDTDDVSTNTDDTTAVEVPLVLFPLAEDSLYGYIDASGEWKIEPQYHQAHRFSDDLAPVMVDSLWGYINLQNEMIIEPQFTQAGSFRDGRAAVQIRGKYGYVSERGVLEIGATYDRAWAFSEGLGLVNRAELFGFVNSAGELVIPCQYLWALPFSEGKAVVVDSTGGFGYVYEDGRRMSGPLYRKAWSFQDGYAAAQSQELWGYIDESGLYVRPPEWEACWSFSERRGLVQKSGLWGYVDTAGQVVIAPQYADAWDFSEGLAAVKKDSLYGFIDHSGTVVIPFDHPAEGKFRNGLALIEASTPYYVDQSGARIVPHYSAQLAVETENTTAPDTPVTVYEEPVAPVVTSYTVEADDAWENRELALGRHSANAIVDQWSAQAHGTIMIWGQNNGRIMAVEARELPGQDLVIELVTYRKDGRREAKPLIGADIQRAGNKELILDKVLNNIWYWDGQDYIPSRLKDVDYIANEAGDGIVLDWSGKTYDWRLTKDGWEFTRRP